MSKKPLIIGLSVAVLALTGYLVFTQPPPQPSTNAVVPSGWQTVDTGKFTIALPSGWEYVPSRGIDSFVGEFVGDGVTLSFDYGWYSGIPEYNDASNVTITTETIDGYSAQIVVPTVPGTDTVGVYFSDLGSDNRLSITSDARTAEEQEVVLVIFRSLQFTEISP